MENDFPPAFLILICAVLFTSCTTISFKGKGLIPLYLTERPDHQKYVEVKGHKEFYLWGLVGPDTEVFMDEEIYDQGFISAANVTVQEYQDLGHFLSALFSFGFYIPKDYKVTARGVEGGSL